MVKLFNLFIIGLAVMWHNVESQDTREYNERSNGVTSQECNVLGVIAELQANIADLKLENAEQASEIRELRRKSVDSNIAFTAVAYEDAAKTYRIREVVQFEEVYTNIGRHYNATAGIFKCPVDGLYGFFTNGRTRNNQNIFMQIVHESKALTSTGSNSEDFEQGSTMAIVECSTGQRVWIQSSHHTNTIHSHYLGFTSFSGFLITKY